jgi:FliI/YscN family ATPase
MTPKRLSLTDLPERFRSVAPTATLHSVGRVSKVVGLTLESRGPVASVGDLVRIGAEPRRNRAGRLAQVVGFRDGHVLLNPYENTTGIRVGDRAEPVTAGFRVPVGDRLLGRTIDALGRPIDGGPPLDGCPLRDTESLPPPPLSRPRITEHMPTGIRAIDAVAPCGCGQRLGIFAGSGVGKSTLLGMLCRYASADVNVVALVGERGKEVRDFLETSLQADGLAKSVVVAVTSDRPAMQRVKAPETAMTIAEQFRDQGKRVLLVMDSLTRYAMAQREIGLAAGEPPTTRGYPPSVFSLLPKLLERAGTSERGSITGFFTVLVEGDDMNDPVGDTVRAIVDGHIVLSRDLAMQGHYPPVDTLASLSRCTNDVGSDEHLRLARALRRNLALYERTADMIAIGAYKRGNDAAVDRAVELKPALDGFLQQQVDDDCPWPETLDQLRKILPPDEDVS